jgi:putative DNA primase/helicase
MTVFMTVSEVHARVGNTWPQVLASLSVPEEYRREKIGKREIHGPCPDCGGTDRYFFDNRHGRGDFYCRNCGAGDGFKLLQIIHGWDFKTTINRVIEAAGLAAAPTIPASTTPCSTRPTRSWSPPSSPASTTPPARVLRLRREACALHDCDDALDYLDGRHLWPAATVTSLRAHASVDYYDNGQRLDRHAALIAEVRDYDGALITLHVTYLANGQKLTSSAPRKILSPMQNSEACAVRLYGITGDSMGIGEGLETCIAAATIHKLPTWSALNTTLLAKFTPPAGVKRLMIFADNDVAGISAAARLMERLQGKVHMEIKMPPAPAKDWADVLEHRACR